MQLLVYVEVFGKFGYCGMYGFQWQVGIVVEMYVQEEVVIFFVVELLGVENIVVVVEQQVGYVVDDVGMVGVGQGEDGIGVY